MQKINFQDLPNRTTPISAANLNAIQNNVENAIGELENVELIAVSDTAPSECSTGDKYYNTIDKKIYTATSNNTWGATGEDPISGIFYIVFDEQSSYSWDGTDLVSVGGGKEDIVISDTEPTDENVKLWIDTGEVGSAASEITNEYSESTGIGYSANYVNKLNTYSTDEVRVGTWINNKPLYRKVVSVTLINGTVNSEVISLNIEHSHILCSWLDYENKEIQLPVVNPTDAWQVRPYTNNNNKTIQITNTNSDYVGKTAYVVVEYTKATD